MNSRVALFGQTAPVGSDGIGRRVLYRCQECQHIWLQDARLPVLDLKAEEVQRVCTELEADLTRLPLARCCVCLGKHGGGSVSIDEYGGGRGYGLAWELPRPLLAHVHCCVQSLRWAQEPASWQAGPDIPTNVIALRALLDWAQQALPPSSFRLLEARLCELQNVDAKAGFGQEGTEGWKWQGCIFSLPCPVFEDGKAIVTLMQALPPEESFDPFTAFSLWKLLMQYASLVPLPLFGSQARQR